MQKTVSESSLEKISFLVGDWLGKGKLDYPGPPVRTSNYRILGMCKWSPGKAQLLLVTFDDDPETQTMFHATQAFVYHDRDSGQLRIKRHWMMESDGEGFVTVEKLTEKQGGRGLGFTIVEREGVPPDFQHDGTIEQVNDSEMVIAGEVRAGGKSYPYVDKYTRRTKPTR